MSFLHRKKRERNGETGTTTPDTHGKKLFNADKQLKSFNAHYGTDWDEVFLYFHDIDHYSEKIIKDSITDMKTLLKDAKPQLKRIYCIVQGKDKPITFNV